MKKFPAKKSLMTEAAIPEPTPEQAAMFARVRRMMLIAGLTSALAVAVVLIAVGYRLYRGEGSPAAANADIFETLPKGAKIVSTAVAGERPRQAPQPRGSGVAGALRACRAGEPVGLGLADAVLDDVLRDVRGEHRGHRVGRLGAWGRAERARRADALLHWLMRTGIMRGLRTGRCGNTAIVPPRRAPSQAP